MRMVSLFHFLQETTALPDDVCLVVIITTTLTATFRSLPLRIVVESES